MLLANRAETPTFASAEGRQNQDMRGRATGTLALAPDQVAAIRRTERPRELELGEAK
jgi:hypothetical protein